LFDNHVLKRYTKEVMDKGSAVLSAAMEKGAYDGPPLRSQMSLLW